MSCRRPKRLTIKYIVRLKARFRFLLSQLSRNRKKLKTTTFFSRNVSELAKTFFWVAIYERFNQFLDFAG